MDIQKIRAFLDIALVEFGYFCSTVQDTEFEYVFTYSALHVKVLAGMPELKISVNKIAS